MTKKLYTLLLSATLFMMLVTPFSISSIVGEDGDFRSAIVEGEGDF